MTEVTISTVGAVATPTPVSAATVAELVELTKRYLYTNSRDSIDKLATSIDALSTTVTLTYGNPSVQPGSLITIGLEEFYIWDVTGKTLTVERGRNGTSATTHPAGSIITINPKFSDAFVFRGLNTTIQDISAEGLYAMLAVDLTWDAGLRGYDLVGVSDIKSIYEIRRLGTTGNENEWPLVNSYSFSRVMNTANFPSSYALFINEGGISGNPIRVRYKAPFNTFSSLTDNVTQVSGAPPNLHNLLCLGAAMMVSSGREIRRNFDESQGGTRRASEVPPGANLNSYAGLALRYRQSLIAEKNRLSQQFPDRKSRVWDLGLYNSVRFG